MKTFIGVDTYELNDKHGEGVALVFVQNSNGCFNIVESLVEKDRKSFYKALEELKTKYNPCKILAWGE